MSPPAPAETRCTRVSDWYCPPEERRGRLRKVAEHVSMYGCWCLTKQYSCTAVHTHTHIHTYKELVQGGFRLFSNLVRVPPALEEHREGRRVPVLGGHEHGGVSVCRRLLFIGLKKEGEERERERERGRYEKGERSEYTNHTPHHTTKHHDTTQHFATHITHHTVHSTHSTQYTVHSTQYTHQYAPC